VWLNVANPSFQPDDTAAAVVIVYNYPGPCGSPCGAPSITSNNTVSLTWENGRFTTPLADMPIFSFPPDTDGSGNNLSVSLREDPSYCATGTTF
jgi:hypothetical protein